MSSTLPGTPTPSPAQPVTVLCAASYYADRGQYAFNFRVPDTNTRFTIHASNQDSYQVGESYTMILATPDAIPLPLSVEDIEFLRHCLTTTAQRWREAIAETDTGADRAPREHAPEPDHVNAEPTPTGYQNLGRLFRDELGRVEQLNARLGEFSRVAGLGRDGDRS